MTAALALDGNFLKLASQFLGESTGSTQSAPSALLPAVIGVTAQKGATRSGATGLMSLLDGANLDTASLVNPASLFGGSALTDLLKAGTSSLVPSLFGNKSGALATSLSSASGIKGSSAANLIAMIVPLALTLLKKVVGERGLNASALSTLLGNQTPYLQGAIDTRMAGALGFASPGEFIGAAGSTGSAAAAVAPRSALMRWVPWLFGAAAAIVLWSLLGSKTTPSAKAAGVAETSMEMKPPMFVEVGAATTDAKARRVEVARQ